MEDNTTKRDFVQTSKTKKKRNSLTHEKSNTP